MCEIHSKPPITKLNDVNDVNAVIDDDDDDDDDELFLWDG